MLTMRVLLISPLDPLNPPHKDLKWLMGGESTYTKTLLENPPPGVEYVHYEIALKTGEISYGKWQNILVWLIKVRILPLGPRVIDITVHGRFDLIHAHVHPVRVDKNIPVIWSDSSANWLTLKYYFCWPQWRIDLTTMIQNWVFGKLHIINTPDVVWSEFAKRAHGNVGEVVRPGLPKGKRDKKEKRDKRRINLIFIGTWFERKGGRAAVAAYRNLRKSIKRKRINMIVVGQVPKDIDLTGIEHYEWLPRETLERKVFARGDVLLHLPPVIEGFGFVVVEAMARGIPVVVTSIGALPEIVGKTNIDLQRLVQDKNYRSKLGQEARRRFEKYFDIKVTNLKLKKAYLRTSRS